MVSRPRPSASSSTLKRVKLVVEDRAEGIKETRTEREERNTNMSQAMSAHGEAAAPEDSAPEKPVKNSVELALDERLALTKFLITMSTEW